MAEHAHITAWRDVKPGRERAAMDLWGDAITFYEKAKANGRIEDYEAVMFMPTGGAMPNGIISLWGTPEQVDAIRRDDERLKLQARALVLLDGVIETSAVRGGQVLDLMATYDEVITGLG